MGQRVARIECNGIRGYLDSRLRGNDRREFRLRCWHNRMQAMRQGCEAAVSALARDGVLASEHTPEHATDILWTLLSVRNWEQLILDCHWSQQTYIAKTQWLARRILLADEGV